MKLDRYARHVLDIQYLAAMKPQSLGAARCLTPRRPPRYQIRSAIARRGMVLTIEPPETRTRRLLELNLLQHYFVMLTSATPR